MFRRKELLLSSFQVFTILLNPATSSSLPVRSFRYLALSVDFTHLYSRDCSISVHSGNFYCAFTSKLPVSCSFGRLHAPLLARLLDQRPFGQLLLCFHFKVAGILLFWSTSCTFTREIARSASIQATSSAYFSQIDRKTNKVKKFAAFLLHLSYKPKEEPGSRPGSSSLFLYFFFLFARDTVHGKQ